MFRYRLKRMLPLVGALYLFVIAFYITYSNSNIIDLFFPRRSTELFSLSDSIIISTITAGLVYLFLSKFFNLSSEGGYESEAREPLYLEIEELKSLVRSLKSEKGGRSIEITSEERANIISEIIKVNRIELPKLFTDEARKSILSEEFEKLKDRAIRRVENQIKALGSRANFSLLWGMLFALLGIFVIYYSFYIDKILETEQGYIAILKEYAPRLSLVLIIEIIAFFFLKLYAKALGELRYVQNEMTNIESKLLATNISLASNNQEFIRRSIDTLLATERNFVIEKGQTTIEIEKEKIELDSIRSTLDIAAQFVHGVRKNDAATKRPEG